MAAPEWPQCPSFEGRSLNTALLLNRDHITQLRHRMQRSREEEGVPAQALRPILDNIDTLYDALSGHGPFRQNALDSYASVQEIGFRIRGCARNTVPTSRQLPGPVDAIKEWEDDEETVDVKDESVNGNGETITLPVPIIRGPSRLRKTFNNRNPRVVTVKVMDPDVQSIVHDLGQAKVADVISRDMEEQGLGAGSFSIRILPSGHVRLMMSSASKAQALRDRRKFKPYSFGKDTYVQRYRWPA
ncbi:MAG: hypothetical protein Q9166_006276 [cf. Caloplaca sp. 2 TL-2023]